MPPAASPPKKGRHGPRPGLWRRVTAGRRVLPDVVIIGAQRAGTTSCYRYLTQHEQLVKPIRKEVHYFDSDENWQRGEGWYRAHFPTARELAAAERADGRRRLAIEATPAYMFREWAAERLAVTLPRARLIAVLRDPIQRALSNWKLVSEAGREPAPFEVEVEHELAHEAGREGPLGETRPRGLLARGRYAEQLERLWRHHPREQTLVLHSKELYRDPTAFCRRVFEWLELPPSPVDAQKVHNLSSNRADVSDELRARLREYFRPHDERLWELLGEDWGWGG